MSPSRVVGIVCGWCTTGDRGLGSLRGVGVLDRDLEAGLLGGDGDLDRSLAGCCRLRFGLDGGEALLRGIVLGKIERHTW